MARVSACRDIGRSGLAPRCGWQMMPPCRVSATSQDMGWSASSPSAPAWASRCSRTAGPLPHLELSQHPVRGRKTYDKYIGIAALRAVGRKRWNRRVRTAIDFIKTLTDCDILFVGGGNSRQLQGDLPKFVRIPLQRGRHHRRDPAVGCQAGCDVHFCLTCRAICTAASSALRNRDRSARVKAAGPPVRKPISRMCCATSRPASALPMLSWVQCRPVGATARAPLPRHREASGMSAVTQTSAAVMRSAISDPPHPASHRRSPC